MLRLFILLRFDSVSRVKLLHKLQGNGILYELLGWIKFFLEDRSQIVMVELCPVLSQFAVL